MVATATSPSSISGYFPFSMVHPFPTTLVHQIIFRPTTKISKFLQALQWFGGGNPNNRLNLRGFINTALDDGFFVHESDGFSKGIDFLHLMELRGVRANWHTYLCLLEGCLSSGLLLDVEKLHGRILKSGFGGEIVLCDRIIDIYLALGDHDAAIKVFDDMPSRSVCSWNKLISAFGAKKFNHQVLGLFRRMMVENLSPDETTLAAVLKACCGGEVGLDYIKQIHGRMIRIGFGTNPLVSNLLIDCYAKSGLIDYARKVFDNLCVRDSFSWVAVVSGLSQNGREEEAILLFHEMYITKVFPSPYVFSSVLSACTKIELFELGQQLHGLAFTWGFSSQIFVCNALVTLYCRFGDFVSAEKIFSKMQLRDEVSYNSLISGLAQHGYSDEALDLFGKMQLDCLKPDYVTIASLLSASASTGALHNGTQLHSYAIKAGISTDFVVECSLLDLYVKCSDLRTAYRFFLATETKNVTLWNLILAAYGLSGNVDISHQIFIQMQTEGMVPDQYTYPVILRTCASIGDLDLGEQVHAQIIKTGYQLNVYVCSMLIDMYAKNGKLNTALGILSKLTDKDVIAWTAMIAGYTQHGFFSEAITLFAEMLSRGIQSDNIGFSSALTACAGIPALDQGRQIHAQSCISGYRGDLSIGNALISLYAQCGRLKEAYLAFQQIDAIDNISWNTLISGFAQSGYSDEALRVFSQMNRAGVEPNMFTFCSAVSAAGNVANIKQGKQIHAMVIKTGYSSDIEASNVLISLYAKCGSIDDAKREFSDMSEKREVSWNAMITGYSQHGCGKETLNLFEEMKRQGVMPNHVTFVGVLQACSHVGLVNEGLGYFESMSTEHDLVPKPEHYACVVDLLGRAGLLNRAKLFIEEMPIKPDAMIWRTLLSACAVHKNVQIGEFAAHHLLELAPEDSAAYVLLSNIYAVARKWDLRDQTRQMMKSMGIKKDPGRSWIEVNNSVHAFYVGDRLHPLAYQIYEYLEGLNVRAAEIGYVQDRFSLLNDAERGQKDPTEHIHSEKLAIAFGLLSLPSAIPVCVIKNLRVCNDCHNWIKFVSEVSKRDIVVRDAHRYHHFESGICSCRDYW